MATGSDVSFAALYMLVVVAATVVSGFGSGLAVGVWSAVVWETADKLVGRTDASFGIQVWNGAVRSAVHAVVVVLVATLIRALETAEESEATSRSFLATAAHQHGDWGLDHERVAAIEAALDAIGDEVPR